MCYEISYSYVIAEYIRNEKEEVIGMASEKNLTAKEEKFIDLMVSGKYSQRQAYKKAFPHCNKWKDKTIDERASRLFNTNKAQTRYQSIMDRHRKKAIMTRGELLRDLRTAFKMAMGVEPTPTVIKKIVEGNEEEVANVREIKVDLKAVASLSHQIAKLEGWEVDKIEHSGNIGNKNYEDMTEEELLEIAKERGIKI